jgi:predicted dienelactone hydrolase
MKSLRRLVAVLYLGLALAGTHAQATMGMTVIEAPGRGPITVFYPTAASAAPVTRGPITFDAAWQAAPLAGNRRLVLFSHGSGGSAWVMADLARVLVGAGFVVAAPEHEGDNYRDHKRVGPESWKQRPAEVSAAIDAVKADPRFGALLDIDRVGVYGMSAGGLTALTLAGGRWSPANMMQHCQAHMEDDFPACVGLVTALHGNVFDALKTGIARWLHRMRFNDETRFAHDDARVQAVVASVPMAAPIDMASMASPRAAVALVRAGRDAWLAPRFHVDAVLAACPSCELLADLPEAGHGSVLSPWPQQFAGSVTPLLVDPPGFVRTDLTGVYEKIAGYFSARLR